MPPHRLLFLCTGNYYRSRFAEIFFNSLAAGGQLNWRADSRGLALDLAGGNPGFMAAAAHELLVAKGIHCTTMQRLPQPATDADFQAANRVIALDEDEHRPMMRERFPAWEDRIHYWLVHDLDQWGSETALPLIESNVRRLVRELRTSGSVKFSKS